MSLQLSSNKLTINFAGLFTSDLGRMFHAGRHFDRADPCNVKWNPPVKATPPLAPIPPTASGCGNTNVPLSIIIKSGTAQCHFVYTGFTNNSLEYSANSAKANKTYSSKKPRILTRGGNSVCIWSQRSKWRHAKSRQCYWEERWFANGNMSRMSCLQ
jgi:hypothetical protein